MLNGPNMTRYHCGGTLSVASFFTALPLLSTYFWRYSSLFPIEKTLGLESEMLPLNLF